jgi:hypothetical protein
MLLTCRQRKTKTSSTGCEHMLSLLSFMVLTFRQGRQAAPELNVVRAYGGIAQFHGSHLQAKEDEQQRIGCYTSIAQFYGSHLQAKEDEQAWLLYEHMMALLSFMVFTCRHAEEDEQIWMLYEHTV